MKNGRFSDAQIMGILKRAESGVPVSELCREHGMSSASFYKWRAKLGGMDASMVSQMKAMVLGIISLMCLLVLKQISRCLRPWRHTLLIRVLIKVRPFMPPLRGRVPV